MLASSVVTPR